MTRARAAMLAAVVVAALWAAAIVAWVDAWPTVMQRASAPAPAPVRYAPPKVEVESGVDVDQGEAAAYIDAIVNDPRGWRTDLDHVTVWIVRPGEHGTTPMPGAIGNVFGKDQVAISAEAWNTLGTRLSEDGHTLNDQRTWIVLHEIGHTLVDSAVHTECAGGGPAPVMRAAVYEIGGCDFNIWPHPEAALDG